MIIKLKTVCPEIIGRLPNGEYDVADGSSALKALALALESKGMPVPEEEKLAVFPRGGPFLATKKIGKNNPKEEEIRKTNAFRQEWNAAVSEALSRGVPTGDLIQMKKELIVEPVARSIRKNGKNPELFILILRKAIKLLIEKARTFRPSVLASLERGRLSTALA